MMGWVAQVHKRDEIGCEDWGKTNCVNDKKMRWSSIVQRKCDNGQKNTEREDTNAMRCWPETNHKMEVLLLEIFYLEDNMAF